MASTAWTLSVADDTIPHAKVIEELSKSSFDPNQQCLACMIGKAHQEIKHDTFFPPAFFTFSLQTRFFPGPPYLSLHTQHVLYSE